MSGCAPTSRHVPSDSVVHIARDARLHFARDSLIRPAHLHSSALNTFVEEWETTIVMRERDPSFTSSRGLHS